MKAAGPNIETFQVVMEVDAVEPVLSTSISYTRTKTIIDSPDPLHYGQHKLHLPGIDMNAL